jgi:multicomponent Na+:H+ antiporter subunit E
LHKTSLSAVFSTFVLCFGFWILLTWSASSQELIAGVIVSLAVALFSARFFIHEKAFRFFNPAKLILGLFYNCVIFLWELIKANWDMAKRCYGGCRKVNPGIVKIPVDLQGDYAQAQLANCITLTPGTMTMDIAEQDGKTWYYIHWIDVTADGEEAGEIIKGTMEKWLRRIWS